MGHCNYAKCRKFRVANGLEKHSAVSQHRQREWDLKSLISSFVVLRYRIDYMPVRHMYRSPHEVCSVIAGLGLRHFIAWSQPELQVLQSLPWFLPLLLSEVAVPQRSPQGCPTAGATLWRGSCVIHPGEFGSQKSPKTALGFKSEIWATE